MTEIPKTLRGRTCLITGATSGIGRSSALGLAVASAPARIRRALDDDTSRRLCDASARLVGLAV